VRQKPIATKSGLVEEQKIAPSQTITWSFWCSVSTMTVGPGRRNLCVLQDQQWKKGEGVEAGSQDQLPEMNRSFASPVTSFKTSKSNGAFRDSGAGVEKALPKSGSAAKGKSFLGLAIIEIELQKRIEGHLWALDCRSRHLTESEFQNNVTRRHAPFSNSLKMVVVAGEIMNCISRNLQQPSLARYEWKNLQFSTQQCITVVVATRDMRRP
jgi:hypothetical protein